MADRNLWSIVQGGLVASQGQLTLEEERGDPALVGGHQVLQPRTKPAAAFSYYAELSQLSAQPGGDNSDIASV